jgi:hypothetical protein
MPGMAIIVSSSNNCRANDTTSFRPSDGGVELASALLSSPNTYMAPRDLTVGTNHAVGDEYAAPSVHHSFHAAEGVLIGAIPDNHAPGVAGQSYLRFNPNPAKSDGDKEVQRRAKHLEGKLSPWPGPVSMHALTTISRGTKPAPCYQ